MLAKEIVGAGGVAWNLLRVGQRAEIFFESLDGLRKALRFAVCFSEIEIGERFLGTQAYRVQESGFRSRKIAERDVGKAEQQQRVVVFGMKLQFAFEFHAGLRIGFFAAKLQNRLAKHGMTARLF